MSAAPAPGEIAALGVSRETAEALGHFADLVTRWTRSVNLVSKSSLPDLWTRHIADSAQVYRLAPPGAESWLDVGSGGGFPGIVCAILARGAGAGTAFTLVESDRRKAAFLATAARELDLPLAVVPERIETLSPQRAQVISARALAPLAQLLAWCAPHAAPGATFLFPKGARWEAEVAEAEARWRFTLAPHPSITEPEARILQIMALHRRDEGRHP